MKKLFLIFMLLLLSGCNLRVLDPASNSAETLTDLIYLSFGLMMLVFIVVITLFIYFVRKFRETSSNKNYIPGEHRENKWLELSWTVLPFILIAVLAVPTVKATYDLTSQMSGSGQDSPEKAMVVEVEAQQFNWKFTYENGRSSFDELVLPVGQEVEFHLTSKDVIHSFWIPKLSGKIDVLPGEETRLSFQPTEKGTFQGKCAEFCGSEHAQMRFETRVVSQSQFEQWVKKK